MCHLLTITCVAVLATGTWRSYEVYQPEVARHFVVNTHAQALKYNHDSSIAWFGDRWFCVWNANEPPAEGKPGQLNYVATSRDGKKWSAPKPVFACPKCSVNPVPCPNGTQWQPNLIVVDGQLWAVWSQNSRDEHHGCYVSKLSAPDGKWHNQRLTWDGNARPEVDGQRWRLFPTQNPIRLKSGRVLAPVTMIGELADDAPAELANVWWGTEKRDSVLYTDDGQSWRISPGAVQPKRTWAQWEPTVWQLPDGTVMMFARNNDHRARRDEGPRPAEMLLWSKSTDDGETWTPHQYVPLETVASRMHVLPIGGDRFMMVHNDWPAGEFVSDRQNLALFFTRSPGIDFVAGPGLTDDELVVAYPQMWIHDGRLAVSYSQGRQYRSIKVALVQPLPDPDRYYLFPRSNTPAGPAPRVVDDALAFNGGQYIATRKPVRLNQDGFSLGAWIWSEGGGTLFDNRSAQPAGGIVWGIRGTNPYLYLGTVEHNITSSLTVDSDGWTYTGVTVDNRNGTAAFYMGDRKETINFTAPSPRSFAGTTAYIGHKRMESSRVAPFSGRIRSLSVYAESRLDASGHAWLFNESAEELERPKQTQSARPKEDHRICLDATKLAQLEADFEMPQTTVSSVEMATADRREVLRLCGNASAGVEVDHNDRGRGDRVECEFQFRVENDARQVIATVGDANEPARVVVEGGEVSLQTATARKLLGAVSDEKWTAIHLESGEETTVVRLGYARPVIVEHRPVATWLYLGDGYPDHTETAEGSSAIDVGSVRTRIVAGTH